MVFMFLFTMRYLQTSNLRETWNRDYDKTSYSFMNVEQHCHPHFHSVNRTCPRYLRGKLTVGAGIGHQMSELIFFVRLATQLQATFVYDPFTSQKGNHEDAY